MPIQCVVFGCNFVDASIRIPSVVRNQGIAAQELSERRRREWIRQIGRKEITFHTAAQHYRLCRRHFHTGLAAKPWDKNHPDWIPTLHMGHSGAKAGDSGRYARAAARYIKQSSKAPTNHPSPVSLVQVTSESECTSATGQSSQTPTTSTSLPTPDAAVQGTSNSHTSATSLETSTPPVADDELYEGTEFDSEIHKLTDEIVSLRVKVEELENELGRVTKLNNDLTSKLKHYGEEINRTMCENLNMKEKLKEQQDEAQKKTCADCEQMKCTLKRRGEELARLRKDNADLQSRLDSATLNESRFEGCDQKVQSYTGLPNFAMLMALFDLVGPHLQGGGRAALSTFQQLLLCLVKLRFNLPLMVLADMFKVSMATVSRTFNNTLDVMYLKLQRMVFWPERDCLYNTMPTEFKKYFGNKITVIIDCFEIFVERPSSLQSRAQTFSVYKHHNTIKYLIGIAPQGSVTFVSEGWGGRVSDKHLTEHCSLFDKLLPGDVILADRGFNIRDSAALHCADVLIPAFTKGKSQLCPMEVETTRKIAHLRIHVERVIGSLRQKYSILSSTVPIDVVMSDEDETVVCLDKMVFVCCALVNMCPSVVPFE